MGRSKRTPRRIGAPAKVILEKNSEAPEGVAIISNASSSAGPTSPPAPESPQAQPSTPEPAEDHFEDQFARHLFGQVRSAQSKPLSSLRGHAAKRRKISRNEELQDFIVLACAHVDIQFSKLLSEEITLPLTWRDAGATTHMRGGVNAGEVELTIYVGCYLFPVYVGTFNKNGVDVDTINVALKVRQARTKTGNNTDPGVVWTDTTFELFLQGGLPCLRTTWRIKANPVNLIIDVPKLRLNRFSLSRETIGGYFPSPTVLETEQESSPADFYSSAHIPKKDQAMDDFAAPEVVTELYPFQKRAVKWLLIREGACGGSEEQYTNVDAPPARQELFRIVPTEDGRMIGVSDVLGAITTDVPAWEELSSHLRGGMLTEEMGLGKTVEIIALITLHRRPELESPDNQTSETSDPSATAVRSVLDAYTEKQVEPINATVIVTPPSILTQWLSELARHAPSLRVFHYEGIKGHTKLTEAKLFQTFRESDVVVTTYSVLQSEIHFARPPPNRSLRAERQYARQKSPLTSFQFWRSILDEAQMIESGVSNTAMVARWIPRVNAWAVTGTPVTKDITDLRGLLMFLRYEPYASRKDIWLSLTRHKPAFKALFSRIAMRHTKALVRGELQLPPQSRYVITIPFTPVEEQYYESLFEQMCDECGLDKYGAPVREDWDPDDAFIIEKMRSWLARLRQSALHPEVGMSNRRALGRKDKPLRTVDQVLDAMLEQTELSIRADQRALMLSKLKRGQTLENSPRVQEALEIWMEVLDDAKSAVEDCRQLLAAELANGVGEAVVKELTDGEDEDREEEVPPRIGVLRNRLNNALEVQHMATFFVANAWYQIKTNEELTKPDTPIFAEVEKRETERYEEAKKLRQEILSEVLGKTNRMLRKLEKLAAAQSFAEMPAFSIKEKRGGIESHMIWERLDDLAAALDTQAEQIDEWRERVVQLLRKPLVDAGDEDEITGEEYEQSTKLQDEVVAYLEVLRAAIEDRHDALTGQFSVLVEQESKEAIQRAKDSDGVAPELRLKLWQKRAAIKPVKTFSSKDHQIEGGKSSLNGIISEIRASITALKNDVQKGRGRTGELGLLEELSKEVQRHRLAQTKAVTELKQEIDTFTRIDNLRVEYYRQLQQVSDMVAPLPEDTPADFFDHQLAIEMKTAARIASATSKRRYLIHLKDEGTSQATERICVICQAPFETGSLTVCGHIFCKECIHLWWHAHHNCPICKRKLTQNDLHDITYRPQDLKVVEETPAIQKDHERSPGKVGRGIYSQINQETLNDIKNIELSGPSFTSKVDTLCRHLLWLRNSDPGAKSIVFSQFSQYLEVLSRAFDHHRIGWASLDGGGVDKFKSNSSTEVFLLHARSQSSGLNLVNASHVFLCEPVVNTALELQAIARVDRIGQSQRTTVWLYLVEGTVEENVYEISVQRRLKHIGNGKGSAAASRARTPELDNKKIEAANSAELQDARLGKLLSKGKTGGEVVPREDLWDCLFGNRAGRKEKDRVANEAVEREVARHLGAEAAEERAAAAQRQAEALMARR